MNNHKSIKNHKYTLDESLQALLELDGKSDQSDLLGPQLKYQSNDCIQVQLAFVPDSLPQKQLDDLSNSCLSFRSC